MADQNASLGNLPVELQALVLSHIEQVKTRQILALSSTFLEAFPLPWALPRTFDFEGIAGDDIADHLIHLLDDDRVRSLEKKQALELIGDERNRLCEYACGRNFEVLKWAHNELDLPWAPYPAGRVSDDVLVLRVLRGTWPALQQRWRAEVEAEEWSGVKMVDGRVVDLKLNGVGLTGAIPAEIGQLTSLETLYIQCNRLTRMPAEIGQLTSLKELELFNNQLTSLPEGIGELTSLTHLNLNDNPLTSLPVEIGQLNAAGCRVDADYRLMVESFFTP